MLVFGTKMHIVTFLIIIFEMLFFFYQIVYYLSRPTDKKRLYYLILLYLLIQYNIASGLFPDSKYSLSITLQNIIIFAAGYIMGMYFPYYFYKAFNLSKMKFYAYWGSLLFLFIPFILFFLIPYYITGDLEGSKKFILIIAFLYAISFLYSLSRAIKDQPTEEKVLAPKNEIISVYIGSFFWISLPIISYFEVKTNAFFEPIFKFNDTSQVIEMITTNTGLVMMTIVFIRQSIRQSRVEYEKLLESEIKLQEMNLQLQKSNEELWLKVQERTRELEIANEQRTNTFINLAHDIKTPLTLINNYLSDYIKDVPETESLNIIHQNIEKLTSNIINFFDSERIKKGITIYTHDTISNLSDILDNNILLFQKYCEKKKIEVVSDIQNTILIKADPEALNRIINNIIENATKYTESGGKIHIILNANQDKAYFSVIDTGIGIHKELHNKIFDPYFQINSTKKNLQGMGLGLAITKKILDGLNSSISIISDPPHKPGTEVIVEFPLYISPVNETIAVFNNNGKLQEEYHNLMSINDHSETLPTLLIVEDNIPLVNLMISKLNERYNIHVALNGQEALERLKTIKYLDLIISDVMMDNGDGFELFKKVSTQKRFKHIPFIFLTAKTEDKCKGLELGAIDYISKPFLIEELIYKIEAVLNNISQQIHAFSNTIHQSIISQIPQESVSTNENSFEENCLKYHLTPQEKKIVPLIAKGQTNKEIADVLFISDKTVKKHLQNIFEKVNASGKIELLNKLGIKP